ncbi:MAG: helix-turn-helix domain-containing protein [Candidatus Peribacteraceae bacterium]|jgi:sugar-specific transcriptional regulator TrmB
MRRRLRTLLQHADLSEKEIALYLHLLVLRRTTILELRERAKLPNITVYRTLLKLEERGLVKRTMRNGRQAIFEPLTLRALTRAVSDEQRKLRRLELELRDLDTLLPYMDAEREHDVEDVEIRYGRDAFKEEYLKMPDVLEEEYLHIGNMANMWKTAGFGYESPEERSFIHRRLARNIFARVLDIPTSEAEEVQRNDSREKRTLVLKESLPIMENFLIIGERQVSHFLCDPEHPRVIVIRQPELVATHRSHFETLWNR